MAQIELIMPKMGESIIEATILKWVKKEGDTVSIDETILEIATDKVDSEIPSPVAGKILKILYPENEVVAVGKAIAIIGTEGEEAVAASPAIAEQPPAPVVEKPEPSPVSAPPIITPTPEPTPNPQPAPVTAAATNRFYSPLVRNIASQEQIGQPELDSIPGTGLNGRLTKKDILLYIANRGTVNTATSNGSTTKTTAAKATQESNVEVPKAKSTVSVSGDTEIVEMGRMRKMIADHMVMSKHTSPHVTSFVEADVTNLVNWRNRIKGDFQKKYGEKITYTPLIMDSVVKAIRDYPMVNVSVDGTNIIVKKNINIGMAAALPSGNLIVPVIKNADHKNLVGLTKEVNDLANRARNNKLKPQEIQDGTFTLTNVGTFGNVMGTPIINQPQVAILAAGAIRKKPAVLETEHGDVIAIRQMMFLSLSYDHRVVDGFLGGSFLRRVADYLEGFDIDQNL